MKEYLEVFPLISKILERTEGDGFVRNGDVLIIYKDNKELFNKNINDCLNNDEIELAKYLFLDEHLYTVNIKVKQKINEEFEEYELSGENGNVFAVISIVMDNYMNIDKQLDKKIKNILLNYNYHQILDYFSNYVNFVYDGELVEYIK